MNYIEQLETNYILDSKGNIHRVNIVNENDDNYYIVPVNQIRSLNKDQVFSSTYNAVYNSILYCLKNDKNIHQYYSHSDYKDNYALALKQLKDKYPELFI